MKHSPILHPAKSHGLDAMPPSCPLTMPQQSFDKPFLDPNAPRAEHQISIWLKRAFILMPAIAITAILTVLFGVGLSWDGYSILDGLWTGLIAVTVFWISFTVCMFVAGLFCTAFSKDKVSHRPQTSSLDVAVLMPVYNENVADIFANILAMQNDLRTQAHHHNYSFFILSDSQNKHIIADEQRAFAHAVATSPLDTRLYYRRRRSNDDYKTGNLTQWMRNWGGAYDAALVVDADSLMSGKAIVVLSDRLAQNPETGLVQGVLRICRSDGLFTRLQQFSCAVFGLMPAKGLAFWSGREGNYFGHNAIFRTKAFADCAGLPNLQSRNGRQTSILSHDFVEAALLRRAGWGVEMICNQQDSFEQAPETLIDYIYRDRRWCQGNIQHLGILGSAGFYTASRFHMLYNAFVYLMSPIWCLQILIWIGYGLGSSSQSAMASANYNITILAVIFGLLLLPKIAAAALILASKTKRRAFGGFFRFMASFCLELVMTILITPTIMIHQTASVMGSLIGRLTRRRVVWAPTLRHSKRYAFSELLRFHWLETTLGILLFGGLITGHFSIWTLPIAISLTFAPAISHLSTLPSKSVQGKKRVLISPIDLNRAPILDLADAYRSQIKIALAGASSDLAANDSASKAVLA